MAFYDLTKKERAKLSQEIQMKIQADIVEGTQKNIPAFFSDNDTYIRKSAYLAIGRIYFSKMLLQELIVSTLSKLMFHHDFKIRQTVVNAAGEIGMREFATVQKIIEQGMFDDHHSVRNAVVGSVKKMGQKNPAPVLQWAKKYLGHVDKEIRREICHGIELRGRTHPEDILPLLIKLQFDETARVRNTLVHVLGQIAYKNGCLQTVIAHLKTWRNKELVADAIAEIIDVHYRYRNFSFYTQEEAKMIIDAMM